MMARRFRRCADRSDSASGAVSENPERTNPRAGCACVSSIARYQTRQCHGTAICPSGSNCDHRLSGWQIVRPVVCNSDRIGHRSIICHGINRTGLADRGSDLCRQNNRCTQRRSRTCSGLRRSDGCIGAANNSSGRSGIRCGCYTNRRNFISAANLVHCSELTRGSCAADTATCRSCQRTGLWCPS